MDTSLPQPESIHEMRRKAPMHYHAKAYNAYFSAYLLSHSNKDALSEHAKKLDYNWTPAIACYEAFQREASFALESITKAVIALRIELGLPVDTDKVPATHALDRLWQLAQLPGLNRDQMFFLLRAKRALFWAGRYAAPLKDEDYTREEQQILKYDKVEKVGTINIRRNRPLGWDAFSELFDIAHSNFWQVNNSVRMKF